MPLPLSHVGEDLIAEMFSSLSERRELASLACAFTGRTLADDVRDCAITQPLMFCADAALPKVDASGQVYMCDGEQTVDVLYVGGKDALAIEAKLGETRMGTAEFKRRFCLPCEISRHSDSRLRGSMIAVLDRSLPFSGPYRINAQIDDAQWTVAVAWWLVVRQSVLDRWGKRPDFLGSSAHVLALDTLARQYGSRQQFDQMVVRVVGSDFARGW
jgi:hypothetical protein